MLPAVANRVMHVSRLIDGNIEKREPPVGDPPVFRIEPNPKHGTNTGHESNLTGLAALNR